MTIWPIDCACHNISLRKNIFDLEQNDYVILAVISNFLNRVTSKYQLTINNFIMGLNDRESAQMSELFWKVWDWNTWLFAHIRDMKSAPYLKHLNITVSKYSHDVRHPRGGISYE